jgi:hypothetical protein
VANAAGGNAAIDVVFNAAPGASLDYASILDAGLEFEVDGLTGLSGTPTPIDLVIDDSGIATTSELTKPSGMSDADCTRSSATRA